MLTSALISLVLVSGFPQFGGYGRQAPPAREQTPAQVRVMNAIVDQQLVTIRFGENTLSGLPYGQRTDYVDVAVSRPTAIVQSVRGERLTNEVPIQVQPAYPHTIIFTGFVGTTGKFTPIVIRDTTAARPAAGPQIMFVNAMSDGTAVAVKMNGNTPARHRLLQPAGQTAYIGYGAREYDVTVEDEAGKELFTTKFRAQPGTRYTGVVMGAKTLQGNRAPRIFFYSF